MRKEIEMEKEKRKKCNITERFGRGLGRSRMILEEAIVTVIETYWFLGALVVSHCSSLFSRFV